MTQKDHLTPIEVHLYNLNGHKDTFAMPLKSQAIKSSFARIYLQKSFLITLYLYPKAMLRAVGPAKA